MAPTDDEMRRIPEHMRESLSLWITKGIKPGRFLTAVLSNDLMQACAQADDVNRDRIRDYAMFLYNDAPANCAGSPEKVEAWHRLGGLHGASDRYVLPLQDGSAEEGDRYRKECRETDIAFTEERAEPHALEDAA